MGDGRWASRPYPNSTDVTIRLDLARLLQATNSAVSGVDGETFIARHDFIDSDKKNVK